MRASVVVLVLGLVACGNSSGGRCSTTMPCAAGLVCVRTGVPGQDGGSADGDLRVCMRTCDYDAGNAVAQHLCSDGTACLAIDGMSICWLGGTHPIHSACVDDTQCEPGTVCAPDTSICTQACTVGTDTPCEANESCVDVGGGVCRAAAVTLDGGA